MSPKINGISLITFFPSMYFPLEPITYNFPFLLVVAKNFVLIIFSFNDGDNF